MKRSLLALAIAAFLAIPSMGLCSSISGKVVDEKTGAAINPGPHVSLMKFEESSGYWTWVNAVQANKAGKFAFKSLAVGKYKLNIYPDWDNNFYLEEYYDDVPPWESETFTEIELAQDQDLALSLIELKPRPFYFRNVQITPELVPSSGGKIVVTAKVVNTTGKAATLNHWATFQISRWNDKGDFYGVSASSPFSVNKEKKLSPTVPTTIKFEQVISADSPDGFHDISIIGGKSYQEPMIPTAWLSYCKGDQASCEREEPQMPRRPKIPLKMSSEGKVLEWGELPLGK